ncbi:PREDICTED: uncharacterized protein LOC107073262 isoform X2 [Polistes dominula]|uniref:Uncharacterized protein LOC107073262 isoform X2 n=1 Tax=Polistes dominula TaxID=743375 RepID=A0ABM1JA24_POLDO|nr:PREDICTED: uncharacterized protein LOC107073262 isoform X2 [Polistes dominula]
MFILNGRLKIRQPFEKTQNYNRKCLYFVTQTEEYNWLIDIINRHRKCIEYVSNEAYFIVVFLAMILSVFNFLCIMEYSELSKNIIDRIEFSMYVIGSFFTIYINFYLGQKLLNYSNAVFAELCNIPFYTISKNTQKLLLFMLMRSGKPSFLSIGNMFISSHEVFASLMRKAFSFAMVYYNVE